VLPFANALDVHTDAIKASGFSALAIFDLRLRILISLFAYYGYRYCACHNQATIRLKTKGNGDWLTFNVGLQKSFQHFVQGWRVPGAVPALAIDPRALGLPSFFAVH
jgi:hypothetical protein